MRLRGLQSAIAILLISLLWVAAPSFADEKHAVEETVAAVAAKPEDKLVTRQQALIQTLKELEIPRFQLERIALLLEKNPKATSEEFNKMIDLTAETIPGFLTADQKTKLKKLYRDELGAVTVDPATEFVTAAKLVASKLPVKDAPINPPANPNNPNDPSNTVGALSGAKITPPAVAGAFPDISKLVKPGEDSKGLKALEDKISTLQDALSKQQLGPVQAGVGQDGQAAGGSITDKILALFRNGDRDGGRGRGDDRGGRNRNDHTPPPPAAPAKAEPDAEREKKADTEVSKRGRDRDRERPQSSSPAKQSSNEKGGNGKEDGKKEGDKDKKAEPIIAAGEISKEKKEKPKDPEKTDFNPTKSNDDLAKAEEVLTPKLKPKISLGEGKAAEVIPAQNQTTAATTAAPTDAQTPTGNGGVPGPIVGGNAGGGGGGLGEPPSASGGDEPAAGGAMGNGGPTYNFIRLTEFLAASGGDSSPDVAGAENYFDDTPSSATRRANNPAIGSEPLRILPATELAKGWLMDYVHHWRKKLCEGPERTKVALCFNVVKSSTKPAQPF